MHFIIHLQKYKHMKIFIAYEMTKIEIFDYNNIFSITLINMKILFKIINI